jgi:hypothetical protein
MVESARVKLFEHAIMVVLSMAFLGSVRVERKRVEKMPIGLIIPIILLPFVILTMAISFPYANAVTGNDREVVEIDVEPPFRGADEEIKLMGVVHNTGDMPLEVKLGVDIITTTTTSNATETTVMEEAAPHSRVLYPFSVSPFKFSIKSTDPKSQTTLTGIGKPFIINLEKLSTPNY